VLRVNWSRKSSARPDLAASWCHTSLAVGFPLHGHELAWSETPSAVSIREVIGFREQLSGISPPSAVPPPVYHAPRTISPQMCFFSVFPRS
jgi:hypothetical protein